ncbi:hypothetical protein BURMUCF1_0965 [Burkholderia multivorans ATCC BAA-247]|nr:hypothetical protein BURMUCF1_0965 [Burkholderia multivorans ATCC BAA-247]
MNGQRFAVKRRRARIASTALIHATKRLAAGRDTAYYTFRLHFA